MKVEKTIFLFMAVFFAVCSVLYAYATWTSSSLAGNAHVEPIGLTVFILTFAMTAMIYAFLAITARHVDARPEDDKQGEIAQGAGALGFFPPKSIWPFWCALVAAIMLLGPVFGWWLTLFGAGLGIWAVCGWCFEYYVGDYQH